LARSSVAGGVAGRPGRPRGERRARYASGAALLALVVAEQINARSGIGYILNNANMNQRSDIIIAGILVYAALGIVIDLLMRLLEHLALPWRPKLALA
jgi:sulfonate transport system permease protein